MSIIKFRNSYNLVINVFIIVLAISFLCESTLAYAIPYGQTIDYKLPINSVPQQTTVQSSDFYIPSAYGTLKWQTNSQSFPKVILISDAHCNYEAQHNIANILKILISQYGINLVAVEGAKNIVDVSRFSSCPDEETKNKVIDRFVKEGYVTGPELLKIVKDKKLPFELFGVEDTEIYKENFSALKEDLKELKNAEGIIADVKNLVGALKDKIYSSELKDFDTISTQYNKNKMSLTEYTKAIAKNKVPGVRGLKLQNFNLLSLCIKLEGGIDLKKVERQRDAAVSKLQKVLVQEEMRELVKKSLEFKLGKISALEYYRDLAAKTDIKKYPELSRYIRLLKIYSKIDTDALIAEIACMQSYIYSQLAQNESQSRLVRIAVNIDILDKLVHLKLSPAELNYYKAHSAEFGDQLISEINDLAKAYSPRPYNERGSLTTCDLPLTTISANKFYDFALKRNEIMLDNLLQRVKQGESAVLITGGFHTDSIGKILEKKGIPYAVIRPSITKVDENNPYFSILGNIGETNLALPPLLDLQNAITQALDLGNLSTKIVKQISEALEAGAVKGLNGEAKEALREWYAKNEARLLPSAKLVFLKLLGEENNVPAGQYMETQGMRYCPVYTKDIDDVCYYSEEIQVNGRDLLDVAPIVKQAKTAVALYKKDGAKNKIAQLIVNDINSNYRILEYKGKYFVVREILLEYLGYREEEFLALLSSALAREKETGCEFSFDSLPEVMLIERMTASPSLGANCTGGGWIGINSAVSLVKEPRVKALLLESLLMHGLWHEAKPTGDIEAFLEEHDGLFMSIGILENPILTSAYAYRALRKILSVDNQLQHIIEKGRLALIKKFIQKLLDPDRHIRAESARKLILLGYKNQPDTFMIFKGYMANWLHRHSLLKGGTQTIVKGEDSFRHMLESTFKSFSIEDIKDFLNRFCDERGIRHYGALVSRKTRAALARPIGWMAHVMFDEENPINDGKFFGRDISNTRFYELPIWPVNKNGELIPELAEWIWNWKIKKLPAKYYTVRKMPLAGFSREDTVLSRQMELPFVNLNKKYIGRGTVCAAENEIGEVVAGLINTGVKTIVALDTHTSERDNAVKTYENRETAWRDLKPRVKNECSIFTFDSYFNSNFAGECLKFTTATSLVVEYLRSLTDEKRREVLERFQKAVFVYTHVTQDNFLAQWLIRNWEALNKEEIDFLTALSIYSKYFVLPEKYRDDAGLSRDIRRLNKSLNAFLENDKRLNFLFDAACESKKPVARNVPPAARELLAKKYLERQKERERKFKFNYVFNKFGHLFYMVRYDDISKVPLDVIGGHPIYFQDLVAGIKDIEALDNGRDLRIEGNGVAILVTDKKVNNVDFIEYLKNKYNGQVKLAVNIHYWKKLFSVRMQVLGMYDYLDLTEIFYQLNNLEGKKIWHGKWNEGGCYLYGHTKLSVKEIEETIEDILSRQSLGIKNIQPIINEYEQRSEGPGGKGVGLFDLKGIKDEIKKMTGIEPEIPEFEIINTQEGWGEILKYNKDVIEEIKHINENRKKVIEVIEKGGSFFERRLPGLISFLEDVKPEGDADSKLKQFLEYQISQVIQIPEVVLRKFGEKLGRIPGPIILRASSIKEDQFKETKAGVYPSYSVKDRKDAENTMITIYREVLRQICVVEKRPIDEESLAIIIQTFIPGEKSGVVFSNCHERVSIEAVVGCAATAVKPKGANSTIYDCTVSPELRDVNYKITQCFDGYPHEIDMNGVEYNREKDLDKIKELWEEKTTQVKGKRSPLTEQEIRNVALVAKAVEKILGYPVDIEFTITDGKIYLFQKRPLVGISTIPIKPLSDKVLPDTITIAAGETFRTKKPLPVVLFNNPKKVSPEAIEELVKQCGDLGYVKVQHDVISEENRGAPDNVKGIKILVDPDSGTRNAHNMNLFRDKKHGDFVYLAGASLKPFLRNLHFRELIPGGGILVSYEQVMVESNGDGDYGGFYIDELDKLDKQVGRVVEPPTLTSLKELISEYHLRNIPQERYEGCIRNIFRKLGFYYEITTEEEELLIELMLIKKPYVQYTGDELVQIVGLLAEYCDRYGIGNLKELETKLRNVVYFRYFNSLWPSRGTNVVSDILSSLAYIYEKCVYYFDIREGMDNLARLVEEGGGSNNLFAHSATEVIKRVIATYSLTRARKQDAPKYEGKIVILVVDDDQGMRHLIVDFLRVMGVAGQEDVILEVSTVQEALECVQREDPHIIITDQSLPDGKGTAFIREVRKKHNPHIVLVTGETEIANDTSIPRMYECIVSLKSFGMPVLMKIVEGFIDEIKTAPQNAVATRGMYTKKQHAKTNVKIEHDIITTGQFIKVETVEKRPKSAAACLPVGKVSVADYSIPTQVMFNNKHWAIQRGKYTDKFDEAVLQEKLQDIMQLFDEETRDAFKNITLYLLPPEDRSCPYYLRTEVIDGILEYQVAHAGSSNGIGKFIYLTLPAFLDLPPELLAKILKREAGLAEQRYLERNAGEDIEESIRKIIFYLQENQPLKELIPETHPLVKFIEENKAMFEEYIQQKKDILVSAADATKHEKIQILNKNLRRDLAAKIESLGGFSLTLNEIVGLWSRVLNILKIYLENDSFDYCSRDRYALASIILLAYFKKYTPYTCSIADFPVPYGRSEFKSYGDLLVFSENVENNQRRILNGLRTIIEQNTGSVFLLEIYENFATALGFMGSMDFKIIQNEQDVIRAGYTKDVESILREIEIWQAIKNIYPQLVKKIQSIYPHWIPIDIETMVSIVMNKKLPSEWHGLIQLMQSDGIVDKNDFMLISAVSEAIEEAARDTTLNTEYKALLVEAVSIRCMLDGDNVFQKLRQDLDAIGYGCKAGEIIKILYDIGDEITLNESTGEIAFKNIQDYYFIIELQKLLGYEKEEIFDEIVDQYFVKRLKEYASFKFSESDMRILEADNPEDAKRKFIYLVVKYYKGQLSNEFAQLIEKKLRSKASSGSKAVTLYEQFNLFKEGVSLFHQVDDVFQKNNSIFSGALPESTPPPDSISAWREKFNINNMQWGMLHEVQNKRQKGVIVQDIRNLGPGVQNWLEGLKRFNVDISNVSMAYVLEGLDKKEKAILESNKPNNVILADSFEELMAAYSNTDMVYLANNAEIGKYKGTYPEVKYVLKDQAGPVIELTLALSILNTKTNSEIKEIYRLFLQRLVKQGLISLTSEEVKSLLGEIDTLGYIRLPKIEKLLKYWNELQKESSYIEVWA